MEVARIDARIAVAAAWNLRACKGEEQMPGLQGHHLPAWKAEQAMR